MTPYLSIVTTSRNDNHGEGFGKRMRLFISTLTHLANKQQLEIELIIVDWNPPQGKPHLHEVYSKPFPSTYLSIRYIIVPAEIHRRYRFAERYPLYQMLAKNVGIRRAKGEYILCTNVDILFTEDVIKYIKDKKLNPNCFYRVNRCDIPNTIEETWSFHQQQSFAQKNILARLGADSNLPHIGRVPKWLFKFPVLARIVNYLNYQKRRFLYPKELTELWALDTLACGDFTLMHKDVWNQIKGYVELDLYALHLDSMALVSAKAIGYKQVVLPPSICVYHIDHINTWETMNPQQKVRFVNERPCIGWDVVTDTACYLLKNREVYDFNTSDWGFANEKFEEINL